MAWCNEEFRRSHRWRSDGSTNFDEAWKRYVDLYAGKHYDRKNDTDQLTVNMIFATINVMGPAVAINNPKFNVNARNPQSAPQSVITEEVLNYYWRTYDFQREFRLAVNDWLICGHGWLKFGYKSVKEPEEKKTGDNVEADLPENSEEEGIDDRDEEDSNTESEMIVEDDRPFMERISIFDMFVDPDARHPKEMRWIAQRTWRPVADVKVDSRYSPSQRKKVSGGAWSRWSHEDGDARNPDDKPNTGKTQYAEIIEFYDLKRKKVSTFARDKGTEGDEPGFLIKPKRMPHAFGHPFVMLRNYEVPDTFYPMGDVQQIESLQLELNETRNQMLNYRKKFRRAWLYAEGRFGQDGIEALQSEDDNVMVPTLGDDDPKSAITPLPAAITPPEFFDQSAMISQDIDRISGVSDYQRGAQTAIKRTATEAAMIQDAANARAQDRLQKIEGILSEAGKRVVQLLQQYVDGQQVARIVTMPVRGWFNFDPDRIQGEFDYEVVGGSTEPQNETFRRQSAMQTVDMSIPFIEHGIVNLPALYQKLLRDGMGMKDAERFILDPTQQPQPQGGPGPAQPGPGGPSPAPQALPPGGQPPTPAPDGLAPQALTPDMFAQLAMAQKAPPPEAAPPQVPPELLEAMVGEMPPMA